MRRIAIVGGTVIALTAFTGLATAAAPSAPTPPPTASSAPSAPTAPTSVSRGPCAAGYVGLTFDDGPTQTTPVLLQELRDANATATFFDVGAQMQQFPAHTQKEAKLGEVENHSYDHPYLDELTYDQIFNELLGTNQIAQQLTGTVPVLFRPPYDRIDSDVTAAQYSLGMITALWNIDSDDYDGIPAAAIARNVWNAQNGDVILFHDGVRNTLVALPAILQHLANQRLCTGILIPSAIPHFAWPTAEFGNVLFFAQVAPLGTQAPTVASLNLTPQQMSTGVGPDAAVAGD